MPCCADLNIKCIINLSQKNLSDISFSLIGLTLIVTGFCMKNKNGELRLILSKSKNNKAQCHG